jgi:hypothetical protein
VIKLKAHPLRHTFLINGATALLSEGESPGYFHQNIENICFKNRYERGFSLQMKGSSVNLPLPFPRMFTKGRLTEHGLVKEEAKDEFVLSVPMMTRLAQDASYLP